MSYACRLLTFLALFIPAAIRYDIGFDYSPIYVTGLDLVAINGDNAQWELGFLFLCKLVLGFGLDAQWLFVLSSFLTCLPIFIFPKKGFQWCTLGFMAVVYMASYNTVRQDIGVAFCIMALAAHLRGKDLLACFAVAVATFFHSSVICVVPMIVAALMIRQQKPRIVLCLFLGVGLGLLVFHPVEVIFNLIERVPAMASYVNYLQRDEYMGSGVGGSGLGFVLWYTVFLMQGVVINAECKSKIFHEVAIWCFIAFLMRIIGVQVKIFARFLLMTDAILVFSLPVFARQCKKKWEVLLFYFVIGLVVLSFLRDYALNSNVDGNNAVLPYQTIFD